VRGDGFRKEERVEGCESRPSGAPRRAAAARRAGLAAAIWAAALLAPGRGAGQGETPPQAPAAAEAEAPAAPPAPRDGELVEEIDVSAPTRLGEGRTPANGLTVQVVGAAELESSGAQTLQEGLRRLPGLNLSDEQGNRFQLDLTIRGFTASPVTGIPQGLSVFVDGVRVNEPAVEEVNFNLVPLEDVERIEVIRGPSAVYGRNTLGGAINIVTRRGGRSLEAEAEAEAGSWSQQGLRGHVSGPLGPLDGYLSVGELSERGWRVDGGAKGVRAFAKLGLRREGADAWISYQFQRDHIQQAGSLPESMLLQDPRQNYTAGDFFEPALDFLTLNAHRQLAPALSLAGNAFLRILEAEQFNSSKVSADTRLFNDTRSYGAALQLDHRATLGAIRNQATAGAAKSTIAGLVGGQLAGIFGHASAAILAELGEESRRQRAPVHRVLPLALGGGLRSYQTSVIPVERIGERRQLVLLVLSDVTELKVTEQHHADLLRQLVSTLSDVVDLHDPYSAHHANRMAEVAQAVARELGLPEDERETLGLAATLANIGKILIPSELLTKTGPLTDADRVFLRKHVDFSLELLKGLDFEGPVLDVIAQKQELLDGSGYPKGLTGQQMTLAGRILSVANAFVALVSARAFRQGVSIDAALEELLHGADTQYDRRVIAALFHVAANRQDWSKWS